MVNLSKYNFSVTDIRGKDLNQAEIPFLNRASNGDKQIAKKVKKMLNKIEAEGESAISGFAKKFDGVDFVGEKVSQDDIKSACEQISPELLNAINLANERIRNYYQSQLPNESNNEISAGGVNIFTQRVPLESAGIYVPGGNAQYPSSVLMNVIPAQVAGVKNIILCTPPNSSTGKISNEVLAAAYVAGVKEIYPIGGVQAIAAMAYGYLVPQVDVICGPGNEFVAQAQKILSSKGLVRVPPAFAGPSEIAIILDETTNLSFAALDLLAQMEHGVGGWAWVISWDEAVLEQLSKELDSTLQEKSDFTIYGVIVDDPTQAIELTNLSAPEHLQINCKSSKELARQIKNAGAIFCGDNTTTALGDYIAGPSHTLPTSGSAKFSGALGISDFQKIINIVSAEKSPKDLLEASIVLAEAEGLKLHAESLKARISKK